MRRILLVTLPLLAMACGAAQTTGGMSAPSVAGAKLRESGGMYAFSGDAMAGELVMAQSTSARRRVLARAESAKVSAPTATRPADTERQIVRSAFLGIERKDPENGVKEAAEVARRLGGWVQRTDNSSATLMVPAGRLDEALAAIGKLGKVAKKEVRGEDVTEEYVDLRIRLDNLERARQRYIDLMAKATSVADTLSVEKELQRVTMEIERIKGRLQYLERVVQNSTILVHFERPVYPGPIGWIFYGLYHGVKFLFVWD